MAAPALLKIVRDHTDSVFKRIWLTVRIWWWSFWNWTPMYWLRCHTFTRYHIIDVRGHGRYKWGYTDPSHLMLLANFAILVDFIEQEEPFDVIDFEGGGQADIEKELKELYHWWKVGRDAEHKAISDIDDIVEWGQRHDELDDKDQAQLLRLIKIRNHLWT